MTEQRLQRRLAAIMAADVVGYTRLMDLDEAGTLARLQALRREVFDPRTKAYGGRIFKTTGDGALAEFPSATDAVQAALDIQRELSVQNQGLPEAQRIVLRVGISLGDVIVDGDDLYGNGVNVAARMEALAQPGDICVSANVHEHVAGAVNASFEDLGEQTVKNLPRPVRCYRLATAASAAEPTLPESQPLTLPDKPSIAVLPFENMSGDPEQEFFADGMTEDIITALSRYRSLFVIARNSTFAYKGQSPDLRQVSTELGVRYVLEGSIRKAGQRIRVTAQLIEGTSGAHIWAERYDRQLDDIFELQDEITETISAAIEPELGNFERSRLLRKAPESLDAWESHQRGMWHLWRATSDDLDRAIAFFEQALELHPDYAPALAGIAYARYLLIGLGIVHGASREATIAAGEDIGRRAIAADDRDYFSYLALARILTVKGAFEEAVDTSRMALQLNPNTAHGHHALGVALICDGHVKEALAEFEAALRLSPMDPHRWATKIATARAYYFLRQYDLAEEWSRKSLQDHLHNVVGFNTLAAALAQQGRIAEAKAAIVELNKIHAGHTAQSAANAYPMKNPEDNQHLIDGLVLAGMPENCL
jgi:adenylate cyclase